MMDEKKKLKTAKWGIVALFILNVLWISILIFARHQRERIIREYNRILDEQVENCAKKTELVDTLTSRLKKCEENETTNRIVR